MKIGLFIPCYRGQIRVETHYSHLRDLAWALGSGHAVWPFHLSGCSIERARNWAVVEAKRLECDLLLMQDADVYVEAPASGLEHLMRLWGKFEKPALIGAAVPSRRGVFLNCEPQDGTGTFAGSVGAGLILLDVKQLGDGPWFRYEYENQGASVKIGEDLYACKLLRERGLRVLVNTELKTAHVDESHLRVSDG